MRANGRNIRAAGMMRFAEPRDCLPYTGASEMDKKGACLEESEGGGGTGRTRLSDGRRGGFARAVAWAVPPGPSTGRVTHRAAIARPEAAVTALAAYSKVAAAAAAAVWAFKAPPWSAARCKTPPARGITPRLDARDLRPGRPDWPRDARHLHDARCRAEQAPFPSPPTPHARLMRMMRTMTMSCEDETTTYLRTCLRAPLTPAVPVHGSIATACQSPRRLFRPPPNSARSCIVLQSPSASHSTRAYLSPPVRTHASLSCRPPHHHSNPLPHSRPAPSGELYPGLMKA
ncbi:hypothetical protein CC78DRAFT_580023 [Lojkania enalia]|uniref:Uncharacterized protein n=1 Tax=Lojkania enalia TaxID=147567 RepID=A0A9P4KBS6_9PLEO|nr:hypothetical protein CC78DRAFT_580023 [Didymosphaeria enalia]